MPAPATFMVVIHDVAPPHLEPLKVILRAVRERVDSRFAAAVVPSWHGRDWHHEHPAWLDLIAGCDEYLLHGWTHRREHRPGLISRLTDRSDEFAGLKLAEIERRIQSGNDQLMRLMGITASGLVPPAWQLPAPSILLDSLAYVMRFGHLESCSDVAVRRRLATWSFDWGHMKSAAWMGDMIGYARWKLSSAAIPCVVIHPKDVARGWMPRITHLIGKLLDDGFTPTVPREALVLRT